MRKAGGEMWIDETLDDWPDNDFRLFCGDLGNEVTDEILATAFRKFPSFNKAKVIRDKTTEKTKGFGFLSFGNKEDYIKAYRTMNRKYVGNRRITLKASKWKDKSIDSVKYTQKAKFKRKTVSEYE